MTRKSFVTKMPDKAGAFLRASRIIAGHGGNIVRVSYNKAVDLHMLFIDVEASPENLREIEHDLLVIGYLVDKLTDVRVLEVVVRIPDTAGAVLPVLEILNRYAINISYLNSSASGVPYQSFKLGLLIENPKIVKTLLDEIGQVYPIDIIDCDASEEELDNTVFYIRLANEMQGLLGLDDTKARQFLSESNRILQALQSSGEKAGKVFDHIRRFAAIVSSYRGAHFHADVQKLALGGTLTLYSIQPYCGSNTYVFVTPSELVLIDSGYTIYAREMLDILNRLIDDFERRPKRVYITHADVDHCGMLSKFKNAEIVMNQKSYDSIVRQRAGLPDYRESTALHMGYSKISRIISGYIPPDPEKIRVMDTGTPADHRDLLPIETIRIGDKEFVVYEGSGGHLYGELIYASADAGIVFTGDLLVNYKGFSWERSEFNSLAPYLMKSVNVDSGRAREMRARLLELIDSISAQRTQPCVVCGGHGPLSKLVSGALVKIDT
ncbi:Glyoxylase, beta-lactamase superfamily II [Sporobacter termitidis DSM 10068]|uniref:Glyoxylase, beta-lactamase superfamily II n=1 Tax=Sporobacter termitidis DSM 10068 TaxID=1123282 RepID=A0A1M5ZGG0_9FIRM|nr:MBL fold metallo-hydrolase [Sporobacter termitidis]SHI23264.1 Glyoxylase, beta-lactamase superfamily II [Sporobacter termitidis DSM 10068]